MNGGWDLGSASYLIGFGSLVSIDLLVRLIPTGPGGEVILPALVVLSANLVFDPVQVGWGISWTIMFLVMVQLAPYLFPQSMTAWSRGLPARLATAVTAVLVGMTVEVLLVEWLQIGTTPHALSPSVLGLFLLGLPVLWTVTRAVPAVGSGLSLLSEPDYTYVTWPGSLPLWFFAVATSIMSVLAGVTLGLVALLFPIPELLILGVGLFDVTRYRVGHVNVVPARRDIAERIAAGASVVWQIRTVPAFLYTIGPLFLATVVSLYLLASLQVYEQWAVNPAGLGFVVFTLGSCLVYTSTYAIRQVEHLLVYGAQGGSADGASPGSDRDDRTPAPGVSDRFELEPPLPGFLVPSGVLLGAYLRSIPEMAIPTPNPYVVTPPTEAWVLSLVFGGVALLSIPTAGRWPRLELPIERTPRADAYLSSLLSPAVFVLVGGPFAGPDPNVWYVEVGGYAALAASASIVFGYPLFLAWSLEYAGDNPDGPGSTSLPWMMISLGLYLLMVPFTDTIVNSGFLLFVAAVVTVILVVSFAWNALIFGGAVLWAIAATIKEVIVGVLTINVKR